MSVLDLMRGSTQIFTLLSYYCFQKLLTMTLVIRHIVDVKHVSLFNSAMPEGLRSVAFLYGKYGARRRPENIPELLADGE